jgi:hypothetical protein
MPLTPCKDSGRAPNEIDHAFPCLAVVGGAVDAGLAFADVAEGVPQVRRFGMGQQFENLQAVAFRQEGVKRLRAVRATQQVARHIAGDQDRAACRVLLVGKPLAVSTRVDRAPLARGRVDQAVRLDFPLGETQRNAAGEENQEAGNRRLSKHGDLLNLR